MPRLRKATGVRITEHGGMEFAKSLMLKVPAATHDCLVNGARHWKYAFLLSTRACEVVHSALRLTQNSHIAGLQNKHLTVSSPL